MVGRGARGVVSRERWAAQIAALDDAPVAPRPRREPLSTDRVVAAALRLVEADGYDALTMRRVAAALEATPGALYAYVRDKAELDDLMLGELCSRVVLPVPDPDRWQEQALDVCRQLHDEYLRCPGIWRATVAAAPHSLDTLRIHESLLAILLAGGLTLRDAAWTADAALLHVGASSVMAPRRGGAGEPSTVSVDRAEVVERLAMLPADRFPITAAHAGELTSGGHHERFAFALGRLFGGPTHLQPGPSTSERGTS